MAKGRTSRRTSGRTPGTWRRLMAMLAGLGGAAAPIAIPQVQAESRAGEVRAPASVPQTWSRFAVQVQTVFQAGLAGDDERALRAREAFKSLGDSVVGRVWVLPSGTIHRLEFEGAPGDLAADMRAVLIASALEAPPPDMPQPLRLRLRLSEVATEQ